MTEKPNPKPIEVPPAEPHLGPENFQAQADDVLAAFVHDGRFDPDGYRLALEVYVEEERREGNQQLADLAETILDAPLVKPIQAELSAAQAKNDLEKVMELKPAVIKFNHQLRDLIYETPPGMFTREELSEWLKTSSNDPLGSWVEPMLSGIVAEVAVVKRLQADSKVETVRFAKPSEETKNVDVVAVLKPTPGLPPETRRIQVKCGQHRLADPVTVHRNGVAEVGFTPDMLQGFGFAKEHRADASAALHFALVVGFTPGRR